MDKGHQSSIYGKLTREVGRARRLRGTCSSVIRYAVAAGRAQRDVTVDLQGAPITPKVKHHAAIIEPYKVGAVVHTISHWHGWGVASIPASRARTGS